MTFKQALKIINQTNPPQHLLDQANWVIEEKISEILVTAVKFLFVASLVGGLCAGVFYLIAK